MKPLHWILIAAVALTPIYGGMGLLAYKVLKSPDTPPPAVVVPATSLKSIVTDAKDRANMAGFYRDFAKVIESDTGSLKDASQFKAWHSKAAKILADAEGWGKYPGLDKAISDRITAAIGLEDGALDPVKRAKLVAEFKAISAELGG